MTVYRWTGATSGAWTTVTNWTPNGNPGAGDDVLFTGVPTTSPDGATLDLDLTLAAIRVANDYTGSIGSAATPLIVGATIIYIEALSAGNIYLQGKAAAPKNLTTVYILDGNDTYKVYLKGAYIGTVYLEKGNVEVITAATIIGLDIGYKNSPESDVKLLINDSTGSATTLPATVECRGGQIQNFAGDAVATLTTLNLLGGTWQQGDLSYSACGALHTINQRGGKLRWHAANITALNLYAGEVDGSEGKQARTCTTLSMWAGAIFNMANGVKNITVTNAINVYGSPVNVGVDPGRTLTVA